MATIFLHTIEEIQALSVLDGDYQLANDIDASDTVNWNAGLGFAPIYNFRGTLNGNGYTISNLFIKRDTFDNIGMFSYTYYATISNLNFTNVDMSGDTFTLAVVAAVSDYTTFNNVTVQGTLSGAYEVASISGRCTNGTFSNCHCSVSIDCTFNTGGLVGTSSTCDFQDCSAEVTMINASSNVGGLIGSNSQGVNNITNCTSSGTITSSSTEFLGCIGGLCGISNSIISFCSSSVDIVLSTPGSIDETINIGGFVGLTGIGKIEYSFSTGNVTSFTEITSSGIYLGGFVGNSTNCNMYGCYSTGNVSCSKGVNSIGGFIGRISMNGLGSCDLCYSSGEVTGNGNIGGFAGTIFLGSNDSHITGCSSTGNVIGVLSSYSTNCGGFIGVIESSSSISYELISKCKANGNITSSGTGTIGGFVGDFTISTINDCFATGNISNTGSDVNICGGFVGRKTLSSVTKIVRCYSTGLVSSLLNDTVGGFSAIGDSANIKSCYWDKETSGQLVSSGGTGKLTTEMKTQSTFISDSTYPWDFSIVWNIQESLEYPVFLIFFVTYDSNGSTSGSVPVDGRQYLFASNATVLTQNNLEKTGYIFYDWNTISDGTGLRYSPGNTCYMDSDKILYAQWQEDPGPSYWDTQASGIQTSPEGQGKTTNEMKIQQTFQDWKFNEVWYLNEAK